MNKTIKTLDVLNGIIRKTKNRKEKVILILAKNVFNDINSSQDLKDIAIELVEEEGFTEFARYLEFLEMNIFEISLNDYNKKYLNN